MKTCSFTDVFIGFTENSSLEVHFQIIIFIIIVVFNVIVIIATFILYKEIGLWKPYLQY